MPAMVRESEPVALVGENCFCESPIDHRHKILVADHDIFGLQIAMDYASLVRSGDSLADMMENPQKPENPLLVRDIFTALVQQLFQRLSLDLFHDVKQATVLGPPDSIHGKTGGVVYGGRHGGFVLEPFASVGIVDEIRP